MQVIRTTKEIIDGQVTVTGIYYLAYIIEHYSMKACVGEGRCSSSIRNLGGDV